MGYRPAIEGVNATFASDVAVVVSGGCGREQKRVGYWRDGFLSLSDLLCWPMMAVPPSPTRPAPDATEFLTGGEPSAATYPTVAFHPDLVAERINETPRRDAIKSTADPQLPARPAEGIPEDIVRAIEGKVTAEDRKRLQRPRVIFSTTTTRSDPMFEAARIAARARRRPLR
jgi:hypothetical protein